MTTSKNDWLEPSPLYKIRFKGDGRLITDSPGPGCDGFITYREFYQNGITAVAHLLADGRILQFGKVIGNAKDIKWLGEARPVRPTSAGFGRMVEAWMSPPFGLG